MSWINTQMQVLFIKHLCDQDSVCISASHFLPRSPIFTPTLCVRKVGLRKARCQRSHGNHKAEQRGETATCGDEAGRDQQRQKGRKRGAGSDCVPGAGLALGKYDLASCL